MYNDVDMARPKEAYAAGQGQLSPMRETRRQRLMRSKAQIQIQLSAVQKALDALDSHPELEEFIETLANAGA